MNADVVCAPACWRSVPAAAVRSPQKTPGAPALRQDGEERLRVLAEHGIRRLYHFTDRANLPLIKALGGLWSWPRLEKAGVQVPRPGSNALSRNLDLRYGVADFVHTSFVEAPKMLRYVLRDGRIADPVLLEIDPQAIAFDGSQFCIDNAASSRARVGDSPEVLRSIIAAVRTGRGPIGHDWLQSEVLFPGFLPLRFLVDIRGIGTSRWAGSHVVFHRRHHRDDLPF